MRKWVCLSALVFGVGCGAPGQGTDPASRADQAADLEVELQNENYSDPAGLPVSGRGIYKGFATLDLPIGGTTQSYTGDLDLTVEFGGSKDQVSGALQGFDDLAGVLNIENGNLDRGTDTDEDYTFGADVGGTLTGRDGDYVIDASLLGDMRGRNQDGVTGVVFGDITGPEGVDIFDGTVAATRIN
ncbi:MAG: hypothetical protein KC448_09950 [Yoonia sp.]|nr:hypothetical protein [Yoonia sp.]